MSALLLVASDYTQLAFHALAHLPIPGPGRLDDPRYLEWCAREVPREARAAIEDDAAVVAELFVREGADALHAMPELFSDITQARASATRALTELTGEDVADASVLRTLRNSAAAELLRGAMLLMAPAFARFHRDVLARRCEDGRARMEPLLDRARSLHAPLRDARVELAWALGSRGRAFPRRVIVGVAGDFTERDAATPVVLAMHESSVRANDRGPGSERYVRAEWAALVEVARVMEVAPSELRDAHAAWLASLDLSSLCESAAALGLVDAGLARRIVRDRQARAAELARAQ